VSTIFALALLALVLACLSLLRALVNEEVV
jgi:hypothetical protein